MTGVESPQPTDTSGAAADCGHGHADALQLIEGGNGPAYIPQPLPDEWVVPPDIYHAFSHARPCPDVFTIHVPDAPQRVELLARLAAWCSQERWWIFVPDRGRAWELCQAWPDSTPRPLLLTPTLQTSAVKNPPGLTTLGELHNQIAAQVRGRLQERLQLLQQLQTITLELIQCDTFQAELVATMKTLEDKLQAEAEDEHSALHQTICQHFIPFQQRIQECEARRCQLQEKLRLEQTPAGPHSAASQPPTAADWFSRLKKWLLGRFSSTTSEGQANTPFSLKPPTTTTVQHQSLQEELQATENELAQLHALWKAKYQQLLEEELSQRRQVIQERLAQQYAEHERLHTQREHLIQHLSLTPVEGAAIEQELSQLQRQLREADSLVMEQLQRRLQQVQIFLIAASDEPELQQLRTLVGTVDRIVYESCEQIPEGVLRPALDMPSRHLLIGDVLSVPSCPWEANGAVPGTCRTAEATPWLRLLIPRLDQRPWLVEGECLIARLRPLPPDQRSCLRQEPLADHPDVILRFRDISDRETELVEIVFPLSWGFAARAFVAQELEHYQPAPCGPAQWHPNTSGDIHVCWPVVERAAGSTRCDTIDWGNGVQEWCLFDGQAFYTAALTFQADRGWDRVTAERWLQELLPPETQQRLAVVTSRIPALPKLATAHASSRALHTTVDPTPQSPV